MPASENNSKKDAKSRIIRFLTKGDITLNSDEEKILARWERADFLMRQNMSAGDIILKTTTEFEISKFTADNDIYAAQEVFGKSRLVSKKYIGHLHLQDITSDLSRIRKALFKDDRIPNPKEILALAKLHDSFTKQLNTIPQESNLADLRKPTIIYQLKGAAEPVKMPMNVMKALILADKFIHDRPVEDIDFEEMENDDRAD